MIRVEVGCMQVTVGGAHGRCLFCKGDTNDDVRGIGPMCLYCAERLVGAFRAARSCDEVPGSAMSLGSLAPTPCPKCIGSTSTNEIGVCMVCGTRKTSATGAETPSGGK